MRARRNPVTRQPNVKRRPRSGRRSDALSRLHLRRPQRQQRRRSTQTNRRPRLARLGFSRDSPLVRHVPLPLARSRERRRSTRTNRRPRLARLGFSRDSPLGQYPLPTRGWTPPAGVTTHGCPIASARWLALLPWRWRGSQPGQAALGALETFAPELLPQVRATLAEDGLPLPPDLDEIATGSVPPGEGLGREPAFGPPRVEGDEVDAPTPAEVTSEERAAEFRRRPLLEQNTIQLLSSLYGNPNVTSGDRIRLASIYDKAQRGEALDSDDTETLVDLGNKYDEVLDRGAPSGLQSVGADPETEEAPLTFAEALEGELRDLGGLKFLTAATPNENKVAAIISAAQRAARATGARGTTVDIEEVLGYLSPLVPDLDRGLLADAIFGGAGGELTAQAELGTGDELATAPFVSPRNATGAGLVAAGKGLQANLRPGAGPDGAPVPPAVSGPEGRERWAHILSAASALTDAAGISPEDD